MTVNSAAISRVTLEGEWSLERASDLLKLLAGELAQLLEADPAPERAELEMTGVAGIDACGCQLLALFMENLRRRGVTPVPCGIPARTLDQIELLGFSEAFAAPAKPTREGHA